MRKRAPGVLELVTGPRGGRRTSAHALPPTGNMFGGIRSRVVTVQERSVIVADSSAHGQERFVAVEEIFPMAQER